MEIRVPYYYRKFQCTADKCPDTCCAGWQIVIDEETLEKYHAFEGPFGNRLANSIDWREGVFKQYEDKRCAFLDENNLCDIYTVGEKVPPIVPAVIEFVDIAGLVKGASKGEGLGNKFLANIRDILRNLKM